MIDRNEGVRRQSVMDYQEDTRLLAQHFAGLLRAQASLPELRITSAELAAGIWAFPREYRPIIESLTVWFLTNNSHALSKGQLHLALLEGARLAEKLWIDGVFQTAPPKRSYTIIDAHQRHSPDRPRVSRRAIAKQRPRT